MQPKVRLTIAGTGSYLPETVLSNADLERMVETSDEWITTRTGIKERRRVTDEQASSDLALEASRRALEMAGLEPTDIDAIIFPTITPDHFFPATACLLQDKLGCRNDIMSVDMAAACSGFLYGLNNATGLIGSGLAEMVLVCGAESLTKFTDFTDRGSCILFGDGSGAAILKKEPDDSEHGLLYAEMGSDGSGGEHMIVPAGGSRMPATHETIDQRKHYMVIHGREVFKFAVSKFIELTKNALDATGLSYKDVGMVVPHQVNTRIIEAANKKLGIPLEKVMVNIDRYGNTGGSSVPIALDEAVRDGRITSGDIVIFVAFGAGLTWGVYVMRW